MESVLPDTAGSWSACLRNCLFLDSHVVCPESPGCVFLDLSYTGPGKLNDRHPLALSLPTPAPRLALAHVGVPTVYCLGLNSCLFLTDPAVPHGSWGRRSNYSFRE